ncbi:thermonuclease family protein [Klebsiella pneumoniae]|uniref:thermonuclease family protein n=1 Tax=Klebsiella pneumoniae TaxID=573 RepID=UPI001DCDFCDA|nr:thermonuclease family protein [Klebsiella pneumoniae]EKX4146352.1 thermonuclease family protein [Enterobacter cloacae]MCP5591869.1 thermonuclease family protein [Klebsiella pneumoniae]MCQ0649290.1 thermonuclease family protein [Klebsiella pneumoniae]
MIISKSAFQSILSGNVFADLHGRVVRVLDGDTIEVLQATSERNRIRLSGIDAPEKKQAFGQRSRQFLSSRLAQQPVTITGDETDRYGRLLGTVWLNGQDVNALQVQNGMAWAYRYKGKASNPAYLVVEKEARKQKKGLWTDPDPVEPWKWRMKNR